MEIGYILGPIIVLLLLYLFIGRYAYSSYLYKKGWDEREAKRIELRKKTGVKYVQDNNSEYPILLQTKIWKSVPSECVSGKVKKGLSERKLVGALQEVFKGKVNTYAKIINICPDIALELRDFDFYLAIEIDEKYDLQYRNPIHVDRSDFKRDKFMNEKGWHVVRFSEEQVQYQTLSCVKYIAEIYAFYSADMGPLNELRNIEDVKKEKTWSVWDVKELIKIDYREKMHADYLDRVKKKFK